MLRPTLSAALVCWSCHVHADPGLLVDWDDRRYLESVETVAIDTGDVIVVGSDTFNALSPASRLGLQSAFIGELLASGHAVTRAPSGGVRGPDGSFFLVSVMMVPDGESPHGFAFDTYVTNTGGGEVIAALYTHATPDSDTPRITTRFVATDEGYAKVETIEPAAHSTERIGRHLASELVGLLSSR